MKAEGSVASASSLRPSRQLRRWLKRLTIVGVTFLVGSAFGFWFAPELLMVETHPAPANHILVLGGGLEARSIVASELFAQGWAPRVIVSGMEDCTNHLAYLEKYGVT